MRQDAWSRSLMRESTLAANDLILPLFILEGQGQQHPVSSLPSVARYSIDLAVERAKQAEALGIPCVAVFPCVETALKTEDAREAWNPNNLACRAIKAIKHACPSLGVMVDVALDLYTTHGHDGLVEHNQVLNDKTVEALIRQSLCFAEAGVDALGPSDMMDGRIRLIREALEENGYHNTRLFSYSAKYASALYGPYRDAVGSTGNLGGASKTTYQQDPANTNEALREARLDISEGADMLMVKPASFYLDVIHRLHTETEMPILAYQVSGEYAMIQAAAQQGWIDGTRVMDEALLSIKRAGACGIISYASLEVAQRLSVL
jgi:porphobilinogen synthase